MMAATGDAALTAFADSAKNWKGKAIFVHVDESNDRVMSYFGVKEEDLPATVLVNMPQGGGMKKFFPNGKSHEEFLQAYFDGSIKPDLKSDPIPESQGEGAYVLVGKAFNSVALDDSKDVLVEFYAPWCGHCKSLAPKYDALAEALKGVSSVIVAKMDATANEIDHPDINVSGFPTLKFFPANSGGKVLDYEGPRETQGMLDFIHKNAGIKFTKPTIADDEDDDEHDEL